MFAVFCNCRTAREDRLEREQGLCGGRKEAQPVISAQQGLAGGGGRVR